MIKNISYLNCLNLYLHKKSILICAILLCVIFFVFYVYFIYAATSISFAISEKALSYKSDERLYQDLERRYVTALGHFPSTEEFEKRGFIKIRSPHFVSRVPGVAFNIPADL